MILTSEPISIKTPLNPDLNNIVQDLEVVFVFQILIRLKNSYQLSRKFQKRNGLTEHSHGTECERICQRIANACDALLRYHCL